MKPHQHTFAQLDAELAASKRLTGRATEAFEGTTTPATRKGRLIEAAKRRGKPSQIAAQLEALKRLYGDP
jgi:hypothetical protein